MDGMEDNGIRPVVVVVVAVSGAKTGPCAADGLVVLVIDPPGGGHGVTSVTSKGGSTAISIEIASMLVEKRESGAGTAIKSEMAAHVGDDAATRLVIAAMPFSGVVAAVVGCAAIYGIRERPS